MNWNEVIDNEIKDARGDLKFVGGKGTKTLLIQPNFSRALLYPMRETDKPENPLQVHSKFSRFNFVLIDTDDDKHKAVTTTLAIHRGSSLEYDIFHERMMDAFDIGMEDNICQNCCNRSECNAPDEFHKIYPSDTITSCDFFERW